MNRNSFAPSAAVVAALFILPPGVALAESARNANVWDWKAHEPLPSEVERKEQAARIAPTTQQQQAADRELESIYRSLINAPLPERLRSTNRPG
jgi:hypothetical protein